MATASLEFEKPLVELEKQIDELKRLAGDRQLDVARELAPLEQKLTELREEIYRNLTPWQRVTVARSNKRPFTLDYLRLAFTDFVELHGDRLYREDPAIVGGWARLDGDSVMVVGHQRGRDTKEIVKRNFGMPHPEGYRKALRLMKLAEKFHVPVLTFIDTMGAWAGLGAEERGQSEAIARNLFEMSRLKVPIIATVIGEGGSGGALGARSGRPRDDVGELGIFRDLRGRMRGHPVEGRQEPGNAGEGRVGAQDHRPRPVRAAHHRRDHPGAAGRSPRRLRDHRRDPQGSAAAQPRRPQPPQAGQAGAPPAREIPADGSVSGVGVAHLIEVAFKGNRKEFFIWEQDELPPVEAPVVVEADRGEDIGHVHAVGERAAKRNAGTSHGYGAGLPARRARRVASDEDVARLHQLRDQDEDARRRAMERVKANGLVMKVSDAEWQWDRKKLTFYFTAEKRVDFRTLVRELASTFRTRIELKQIGVRDEAKRLDGVGRCARQYCSASWLPELLPVNLGVAKDQRLSLNPTQISGACGRLMCCLRYEHEFYVQSRKRFPKEGRLLATSRGEEKVLANDIFRERMTLRGADGEARVVPLAELREEVAQTEPEAAWLRAAPAGEAAGATRPGNAAPEPRRAQRVAPTPAAQAPPSIAQAAADPPRRKRPTRCRLPAPTRAERASAAHTAAAAAAAAAATGASAPTRDATKTADRMTPAPAAPLPILRPRRPRPEPECPNSTSRPPSTTPTASRISDTRWRRSAPTPSPGTAACAATMSTFSWGWTSTARR